jgi:flagellar protein FliL
MGKILPILLALIGLGAGTGAGFFLRPAAEPAADQTGTSAEGHAAAAKPAEADPEHTPEYVKMTNQFVIPVLQGGRVASMVILAISLEVTNGSSDAVYAREPKLRDAMLQVLFDHANAGGFEGSFTDGANMILLRKALLEAAQSTIGETVTNVLISDIARQDS